MPTTLKVKVRGRWFTVEVQDIGASPVEVVVDGEPIEVELDQQPDPDSAQPSAEVEPSETPKPQAAPTEAPAASRFFHSPCRG